VSYGPRVSIISKLINNRTSIIQPLDISVNKPFNGFMHVEWAKWIEAPTHHINQQEE